MRKFWTRLKSEYDHSIAALSIVLALQGCGSLKPASVTSAEQQPRGKSIGSSLNWSDSRDNATHTTRATEGMERGLGLVGKTMLIDPVVRPFSTIKALYGYTLKSAGGFVERSLIQRVRLPAVERKPIPGLSTGGGMDLALWERDLDNLVANKPINGQIKFLVDGEEYFTRLYEAVSASRQSVDIRTYIYDNDDVALEFSDLLREKSDSVEIKILVDGLADLFASRQDSHSMPADTVLPASMGDYLSYASRIDFRRQSNPWFTGDHAKVTLIDENLAFVGGMNIGREYRYDWHDLMMEVSGPVVKRLQYEFDLAWAKSGALGDFAHVMRSLRGQSIPQDDDGYPVRILTTSIHNSELYRAQLEAIRRAGSYIYIQNAYFSDDKILFELVRARRRGVDVRVILPQSADYSTLTMSNQTAINTMLRNGIRVFIYPGMTHVKAAIYDGWACLGSANFDKLSLQVNKELNLATSDPDTVETLLERVFYPDFAASTELHEAAPIGIRHHFAELIADEFL